MGVPYAPNIPEWPYLCNGWSDPLRVWLWGRVFGDGGSNGAIYGSNKSKMAATAMLEKFQVAISPPPVFRSTSFFVLWWGFWDGGPNGAISGSNKSKMAAAAILEKFQMAISPQPVVSPQRLTIYLYSAHRAVIFAIAQLSCYFWKLGKTKWNGGTYCRHHYTFHIKWQNTSICKWLSWSVVPVLQSIRNLHTCMTLGGLFDLSYSNSNILICRHIIAYFLSVIRCNSKFSHK